LFGWCAAKAGIRPRSGRVGHEFRHFGAVGLVLQQPAICGNDAPRHEGGFVRGKEQRQPADMIRIAKVGRKRLLLEDRQGSPRSFSPAPVTMAALPATLPLAIATISSRVAFGWLSIVPLSGLPVACYTVRPPSTMTIDPLT